MLCCSSGLLHALPLSEFLSQAILSLLLHLGVQFGVGARQFLLDLSLKDDLRALVIIVLPTEVDGELPRIVSLEHFNALDTPCLCPISIYLDEEKRFATCGE